MPAVERLDLHFYARRYDRSFEAIADQVRLSNLRHCSLHGLRCRKASLQTFLSNHPTINHLELRVISLSGPGDEHWRSLIDRLCTTSTLETLVLKDLDEENIDSEYSRARSINLLLPDEGPPEDISTYFPYIGGIMVHTRTFDRNMLQKGLNFLPSPRRRLRGSPQYTRWRRLLDEEFGPS